MIIIVILKQHNFKLTFPIFVAQNTFIHEKQLLHNNYYRERTINLPVYWWVPFGFMCTTCHSFPHMNSTIRSTNTYILSIRTEGKEEEKKEKRNKPERRRGEEIEGDNSKPKILTWYREGIWLDVAVNFDEMYSIH